jgi:nucleoid DNA-binding protein
MMESTTTKINKVPDLTELSRAISLEKGIDEKTVRAVLESAAANITALVSEYGKFHWSKFGSFDLKTRAAKKGESFGRQYDKPQRLNLVFGAHKESREEITRRTGKECIG